VSDNNRMETEVDLLTGLMNHRAFLEHLEMTTKADAPLSVLLLGLDHLMRFNHDFGHVVGDSVLCGIARTLQQNIHEAGVVSRYGGNQFAILLPRTTFGEAKAIAERTSASVSIFPWSTRAMTASIGVASLPTRTGPGRDLVDAAEKALRAAKMAGGDCIRPI